MARCSACITLLLLLIGLVSAVPESDPARRDSSAVTCQNQNNLSSRLDVVEKIPKSSQPEDFEMNKYKDVIEVSQWPSDNQLLKRVEDTVQKLEEEVASLLDAIESPEWTFLLNSNSAEPTVDILDESKPNPRS